MQSTARVVAYPLARPFPRLVVRESVAGEREREHSAPKQPAPETTTHWRSVHDRLVTLGRDRAVHERELCRWLLAAERLAVHSRAGYANLREYAERTIGLSTRQTEERLRVGRSLAKLPRLDA